MKNYIYNWNYHKYFDIGTYKFLFTEKQYNTVIDFLSTNKIKNDGGYLFGDCIMLEIHCNKVWIDLVTNVLHNLEEENN